MFRKYNPRTVITIALAVLILVPSMLRFVNNFYEFIHTSRQAPDGAFAITPMLNYLLASIGFLALLLWAACNGMFHDIERPKYAMLETERMLDRQSGENENVLSEGVIPKDKEPGDRYPNP
jgi:hypothetical protein